MGIQALRPRSRSNQWPGSDELKGGHLCPWALLILDPQTQVNLESPRKRVSAKMPSREENFLLFNATILTLRKWLFLQVEV